MGRRKHPNAKNSVRLIDLYTPESLKEYYAVSAEAVETRSKALRIAEKSYQKLLNEIEQGYYRMKNAATVKLVPLEK